MPLKTNNVSKMRDSKERIKNTKNKRKDKASDKEDKSLDSSDTDENAKKRRADLLEEAKRNSIPYKKQKKDGQAITGMFRDETEDKKRLVKENNELQATVQKNIAAMKKASSENKELEDDNLKKSRIIQQFKDELQQQEDIISNKKAKNMETQAKLQDIRLKYDNNMIALGDATSKQEDTEAELKNTVSKLEKSRSSEQNLQLQVVNLQQRVRGWEAAAGQANYANPATTSMLIHRIATQMEDGFNRVVNAMAELEKKGQNGFGAIKKEMSKKDN
ncbi:hypothetical protein FDENT_2079 [Fusarium denticulatum]|uniref:Uncharacterized protein n=1 Tax=Fusarium denticulatum TaxID=48507 RepID=A0A8H5XGU9_9HYPO|nr:hypothetical protein FDENT_2079 [Fusarium denticulatum]